jgi:hypothetical protein
MMNKKNPLRMIEPLCSRKSKIMSKPMLRKNPNEPSEPSTSKNPNLRKAAMIKTSLLYLAIAVYARWAMDATTPMRKARTRVLANKFL